MRKIGSIKIVVLSVVLLLIQGLWDAHILMGQNRGFNDGMRRGGRGAYSDRYDRDYGNRYHRGDSHYQEPHSGGIGPGKGAAIGAAGGAALGALFGGGLKGVIIGGAAGAGIGAVAGQANQNNKERDYRDYRR